MSDAFYRFNPPRVQVADETDMKSLEQWQAEPLVWLDLTPKQCPDYLIDRSTGHVIPQVRSIRINGAQWDLKPGRNQVPRSVYEFFLQSEVDAFKARQAQKPRYLGQL
jgi:hypothetical protein